MLPKNILVPTDLSEEATQALEYAVELAGRLGATIHLVNVLNTPALGMPEVMTGVMIDSVVADHRTMLDELAQRYRTRALIGKVLLETGDATNAITEIATKLGCDLIVMGTHARTGVSRFLLGSIAEMVVRKAPCPVLTIHTHDKAEASAA